MSNRRILIIAAALFFILLSGGCRKPSEDKIENNLISGEWRFEYFDVYTVNENSLDKYSNGNLARHLIDIGTIAFSPDHTGKISNGNYSQDFTWSVSENFISFTFPPSANSQNAHPLAYYAFSSYNFICNDDVTTYSILRSKKDIHTFRYREGGVCNLEDFHCIEWCITR